LKYRHIFLDPLLYAVVALNIFLIYEYKVNPDSIHSIVVLYWVQSVLIGIFNFFNIITAQNVLPGSLKINEKPASKGCSGIFFLVHYGAFHVGYLIFMAVSIVDVHKLQWHFIQVMFWVMLAGMAIGFVQQKMRTRDLPINLGHMFFLPYLRIVPMHLMILLPGFLHLSSFMIFLVLKTIFDVLMHILSNKILYKPVPA